MARSGAKGKARGVLVLDVENLLYPYFDGKLEQGLKALGQIVSALEEEMTLVLKVASCSRRLAARLAIPLAQLGVRTHVHRGGPDAADEDLVRRLEKHIPESCDVVIIGSGDHRFALPARRPQTLGRPVIA